MILDGTEISVVCEMVLPPVRVVADSRVTLLFFTRLAKVPWANTPILALVTLAVPFTVSIVSLVVIVVGR